MSVAGVVFLDLDYEPAADGERPQRFGFRCPVRNRGRDARLPPVMCEGLLIADAGHGIKRDGKGANGGRPQWDWDGNREAPTFKPSVNCKGCWHGYIRGGRCVDTKGKDEK